MIHATNIKTGLIGEKLGHSFSPQIHSYLADYEYKLYEIPEDQVENLLLKNVKTGEHRNISVDGVFVAVGIIPASEVFQKVVSCDEKGYLIAGEDGATDRAGIFAAGDVRTKKLRQIVTAVADGANAVTAIQEYLLTC